MYVYESVCTTYSVFVVMSINNYILLLFIYMNYNYELLSVRVRSIGYGKSSKNGKKIDAYAEMVDLIKLQLKTNR